MNNEEFDDKNEWHCNADLIFGFVCQYCDSELYFDDVPNCEPDKGFGSACVIISSEAQKRGWKMLEELSFSCPECSKERGL
ncbi:hypothetical protein [Rheinheimera hassiensis]|uniref:hypothetical protein n=1 Tax=Rheinheimera hassiensis TaxID=1193627 RepID=UPI001F055310|nr:hypothetical protein [Rheinheimera hassiensis]